jgi:hypothetical protein
MYVLNSELIYFDNQTICLFETYVDLNCCEKNIM